MTRRALLGVGGLRPLHSRPERRAGRLHPFWLVAAGCAAGCLTAQVVLWLGSSIPVCARRRAPDPPEGRRGTPFGVVSGAWRPCVFRYSRSLCFTASRGKATKL